MFEISPLQGTSMSMDYIKVEDKMVSKIDSKAPCWGRSYEKYAQNCERVHQKPPEITGPPITMISICKSACREACNKN